MKCDGGTSTSNKASQPDCKAAMKPTCAATVAQTEACVKAIAVNVCDLNATFTGPCKTFLDAPGCQ